MQTSASKQISDHVAATGFLPVQQVVGGSLIHGVTPGALFAVLQTKAEGLLSRARRGAAQRTSTSESFPQDSAEIFYKRGQDGTHRGRFGIEAFGAFGLAISFGSSDFTIACKAPRAEFRAAGKTHTTGCESFTLLSLSTPSLERRKRLSKAVKTTAAFAFRKLSAKN